jgi:hypothetical protein
MTSSYRGSTSADFTYVDLSCLSNSSLSLIWSSLSNMGFSCAVKGALSSGESAMILFPVPVFQVWSVRLRRQSQYERHVK